MAQLPPTLTYCFASPDDCRLLAELNQQLIQDEGHRNRMSVEDLEQRMRQWLAGAYRAVLFKSNQEVAAYALFRELDDQIHLRQLFVARGQRRQGIGRRAMEILRKELWPATKRLTVDVLVANRSAVAFWRSVGYRDYALTLEILPLEVSQESKRD